jgi:hybrid cluster-associated redox disulfide protein
MAIDKNMSIMDVVQKFPKTVDVFRNHGMGCLGCAAARFENIEQGAKAHGIDVDALMSDLNKAAQTGEGGCGCGCGK